MAFLFGFRNLLWFRESRSSYFDFLWSKLVLNGFQPDQFIQVALHHTALVSHELSVVSTRRRCLFQPTATSSLAPLCETLRPVSLLLLSLHISHFTGPVCLKYFPCIAHSNLKKWPFWDILILRYICFVEIYLPLFWDNCGFTHGCEHEWEKCRRLYQLPCGLNTMWDYCTVSASVLTRTHPDREKSPCALV